MLSTYFYVIISIHSARVGGDEVHVICAECDVISIHSARVGGDVQLAHTMTIWTVFQSTPPV